jgi:hypothetical protein
MVNAGDNYISFSPFKLACPFLPTMMWSCTENAERGGDFDGVESPEGW